MNSRVLSRGKNPVAYSMAIIGLFVYKPLMLGHFTIKKVLVHLNCLSISWHNYAEGS